MQEAWRRWSSLRNGAACLMGLSLLLQLIGSLAAGTFEAEVAPILGRRCVVCHGPTLQSAGVRLDTLSPDMVNDRRAAETWHDVRNVLNSGLMPPRGAGPITDDERTTLIEWLSEGLRTAAAERRQTAGEVVMRRLNRVEYERTMRDLLGLDYPYSRDLPPDERSRDGFKNNGDALRISAMQLERYLDAARGALGRAIVGEAAPRIFKHHQLESAVEEFSAANWTNRLGRTGVYAARVLDFPEEGEFLVRVRARAERPYGAPVPRMEVRYGFRVDTERPSRRLGVVDVPDKKTREFVFRGRVEAYPQQNRAQALFPGQMVWIRNLYSDGRPSPKPEIIETEKDGKVAKEYIWREDPSYPKVIIESVEYEAPHYRGWPPGHHRRLLPIRPASQAEEAEVARAALGPFMERAFRRPVDTATVDEMARYFAKVRPLVNTFEQAVRETFAMVLVSPDFLYLVERPTPGEERIDEYELASRLSYFLWSTMPDERLLDLAAKERLREPATLAAEVERMLSDEKSWAFVEQFSNQWLDLDGVDRVAVNPNYYPDFQESLKADMRRETQHFFAEVLENDLSALTFLRSDFAMLNQTLAQHYGVTGPRTEEFERVPLRFEDRRGGLLAQASILLTNSTGEDSHPINRGVWVRKVLFDDPPPPPPPAVPNLDTSAPGLALLPLKRQLEQHRDNAACASCHQGIDPWGVALEEFDAVGRFRTRIHRRSGEKETVNPVDAAATLPDGVKVNGFTELTAYLVEHKAHAFGRALTSKLFAYALGRSLELEDQEEVDRLADALTADGYRFRRHVVRIATSALFQQH